jgi:hypothetical protein
LKCFKRLLENILEVEQQFLNGIHISRPVECQLNDEHSGQPNTSIMTENVEKIKKTHPRRTSLNNP